jgi:phosphatidylglycerophosphatase A
LAAAAVPLCDQAERHFGVKDDHRIVADEYLTFPLCLVGLPWREHLWILAVAFVVNRALDVVKPPPARQAQELAGGLGIVMDDFVTCLYALALNHALCAWLVRG